MDDGIDLLISFISIVQASLGLPITTPIQDELLLERSGPYLDSNKRVQRNAILEAELVCYNESEKRIDGELGSAHKLLHLG